MESSQSTPDTPPELLGYDNMPLSNGQGVHPNNVQYHWNRPINEVDQDERDRRVSQDAMELIIAHCADHPPLPHKKVIELKEASLRLDLDAKEILISSFQRYAVHLAKRKHPEARRLNLPLEDLVQNGMIGLIDGIDRCNPDRFRENIKPLMSYLAWHINGYMDRRMSEEGLPIRTPLNVYRDAKDTILAASELSQTLGREPTAIEMAEHRGLMRVSPELKQQAGKHKSSVNGLHPRSRARHVPSEYERVERQAKAQISSTLNKVRKVEVSLDGLVGSKDGEWTTRAETIPFEHNWYGAQDPTFEQAAETTRADDLYEALDELPYRRRRVLELRYGLHGEHPIPTKEIAQLFDVEFEQVHEIESQALKQMQSLHKAWALREAT